MKKSARLKTAACIFPDHGFEVTTATQITRKVHNAAPPHPFPFEGDIVQELESRHSRWEKAKSLSTRNFEGS